jgi:hypothetical protein
VSRWRRSPPFAAVLAGSLAFALTTAHAPDANAAEDDNQEGVDTANGSDDCRAFRAKNEKELREWEKAQPPVPYAYPRESHFLNAPWGNFVKNIGYSGDLVLATILPHVGAQFRGDAPAAHISWPWSVLVLGPMYSCTRKQGTFVVHGHRVHRVLIEPAVVSSNKGVGFSVRPGYRFIWHPTGWVVGPGIGLGSTIEIRGNQEPFRFSLGPEVVAHFGNCCRPSYFTLAVRYDHYFKGTNRDIIGASLGYTFF